ncbi:uncharacterized protein LOC141899603 [Tubulanus polymorphus]|uniref:uncharacterized protein LOC141899603 n=1 Tax=Tubulanus polymorphus TaxID=672921 RepID=UPI003DA360E1
MMASSNISLQCAVLLAFITYIAGEDFCKKGNYICSQGHCCGVKKCCTYYYELWWFWVIWVLVALLSFCCFYQQRRIKRARERRREFIIDEEIVQHPQSVASSSSRSPSFYKPIFDPSKMLHLPTYEEVQEMPKDPPPYNVLCHTTLDETVLNQIGAAPAYCDNSDTVGLLENEELNMSDMTPSPDMPPPPAYSI